MSASTDIALFTESKPQRFPMIQRIADSYLGRAFLSPFHGMVLGALASACMFSQSALPILLGVPVAEAVVLGALPRWTRFRKRVDEVRLERERAVRERHRTTMMMRMSEDHRAVVNELERLAGSIRGRIPIESVDGLQDLRLDQLIDAYVQLAVSHDEAEVLVDRMRLEDRAVPPDAAFSRRIAELTQRRRACRHENEEKLATLREQLRSIEEAVKLLHERTLLAVDIDSINERVDAFLGEIERSGTVLDTFLGLRAMLEP